MSDNLFFLCSNVYVLSGQETNSFVQAKICYWQTSLSVFPTCIKKQFTFYYYVNVVKQHVKRCRDLQLDNCQTKLKWNFCGFFFLAKSKKGNNDCLTNIIKTFVKHLF